MSDILRPPLDGNLYITGPFFEQAVAGTGLKDHSGIARHIGVDLRAKVGTSVRAPDTGIVTQSYTATSGNQIVEIHIGGYLWRFLHLSERLIKAGDKVQAGQIFVKSGNSGGVDPHLHIDVRKAGTAWSDSLYNFIDPMSLLTKGAVLGADAEEENMTATYIEPKTVEQLFKQFDVPFDEKIGKANQVKYYGERGYTLLYEDLLKYTHNRLKQVLTAKAATLTKESVAEYLKDKGAI